MTDVEAGPHASPADDDALLAGQAVSAVIPCLDEEDNIEAVYAEASAVLRRCSDYEIIFVDDGSTDRTLEIVRGLAASDERVKYLSFTRNFGLEAAFSAGYRYASMPWTVQLDADRQSPPGELPKLLARAVEGYDVVFAIRERRQDPRWRRLASACQHWLAGRVFGIELPRRASIFRVVRTSVASKIVALDLRTPYFMATVPLVGARYTSVPTLHRPRAAGRAKWPLWSLIAHSVELFTGFSFRLLAVVYGIALIGAVAALAGVAAWSLGGEVAWLPVALLALQGLLALGLAIVARYVRRAVGDRVRPSLYYVRESNIEIDPRDSLYEFEVEATAGPSLRGSA